MMYIFLGFLSVPSKDVTHINQYIKFVIPSTINEQGLQLSTNLRRKGLKLQTTHVLNEYFYFHQHFTFLNEQARCQV